MADIDEAEVTTELVIATGEAATLAYPDWTYSVSTRVLPSQGVGTWDVVAYRGEEGKVVSLFGKREISNRVRKFSDKLLTAQGQECMGIKCTVSRSGNFRIEYSYDIDEAIKWANQVFSGLTPEETVEILRPQEP
ncbi:hypothetical protein ACFWUP_09775 [Nocardia sp. NPDC058658]|uniref:hypothetical protein n=1 Tax=Nocardia sp. NPDC058658 TaxID=3346580 RepID=UPI0036498B41